MDIRHSEIGHKGLFSAKINEKNVGQMTYSRASEALVIIDHTEVYPGNEGQGIGKKLVAHVVNWARENHQKIIPLCPFAKRIIEQNPEFQDILN